MRKFVGKILIAVLTFAASLVIISAQETQPSPATDAAKTNEKQTIPYLVKTPQDETKRYRVGIGDEIGIEVFRHPEYSSPSIRIQENGLIFLPRIEQPVQAVCKTENELAAEITERYKKILRQPFIRVFVRSYQSQPVAVIGAVEKAGQLYLNRKMRLMQVVALAGGPNKEAGTRIQVARLGAVDLCEQKGAAELDEQQMSKLLYKYDLKKTLEGDESSNPWMQPGDVVYVSEADKAFVVGNVKEAKAILLKTPRTVTQAIAEAGGLEEATKLKQIFLIRQDENGNKTKQTVDLIAVSQGKQEDPFLKPNDIIEVPTDPKKKTINSIKDAFLKGLPTLFLLF